MLEKYWSRPVVLLAFAPIVMSCGIVSNVVSTVKGGGCAEMASGDFSQFRIDGAPALEADVKAFLDASYTVNKVAADMETTLVASCSLIGKDIGVDQAILDLKPASGEKVCGAVAAKIGDILKAKAGVTLSLDVGTPNCEVDVGTVTTCLGVSLDPGTLKASCQGGDISGQCDGDCQGTCSASANAGPTHAGSGASCSDTCTGGCSVAYMAPKCSGDFKPPTGTSPKKLLACGLKGIAATKCVVPVKINVNGRADADLQNLVSSLQANLPAIIAMQTATAPKLVAAAAGVGKAGYDLKSTLGPKAGLHGGACLVSGIAKVTSATLDINSDVNASASLRVSVSGGTSGGASASR